MSTGSPWRLHTQQTVCQPISIHLTGHGHVLRLKLGPEHQGGQSWCQIVHQMSKKVLCSGPWSNHSQPQMIRKQVQTSECSPKT